MKPIFRIAFAAIIAIFVVSACQNNPKPTPPPIGTNTAPADNLTPPEITVFTAGVAKLNLRETPDAKGKVVAMLEKGILLQGTGKKSDKKVKINFQGFEQEDYFFEVSAPDQKVGWVFGPALTKIFAGKKANMPGADVQNFAIALGKLPTDAVESGAKAFELFKTMLPKGGDISYILLTQCFHDLQFNLKAWKFIEAEAFQNKISKLDTGDVWRGIFDHNRLPETKRIAENGFRMNTTEGFYFPTPDLQKLKANLVGAGLQPTTAEFLDQEIIEDLAPDYEDGGLVVTTNVLEKRAIFWEQWGGKNQYHVLEPAARMSAFWMASSLLIGEDNTPAFDYESRKLNPDFQKSWENVLKTYPNSNLAGKIREMQASIAADGGKRGLKTESWIAARMAETPD